MLYLPYTKKKQGDMYMKSVQNVFSLHWNEEQQEKLEEAVEVLDDLLFLLQSNQIKEKQQIEPIRNQIRSLLINQNIQSILKVASEQNSYIKGE